MGRSNGCHSRSASWLVFLSALVSASYQQPFCSLFGGEHFGTLAPGETEMSNRYYCWNKAFGADSGEYISAESEQLAAAKYAKDNDCDEWEVAVQAMREAVYD